MLYYLCPRHRTHGNRPKLPYKEIPLLNRLIGQIRRKKNGMFFCPYSKHFHGKHVYLKADGPNYYPCKNRKEAITIVSDLLAKGLLEPHHTQGILLFGSGDIEKITMKEIRAAEKKKGS